ncbi:helix-turn-helix domain-containing protein [Streptomyces niveus]|uniref:helix-turn-helix domain-containing protein n=1 Tax=Streptomyces niveus TaxID=193462 RepID=UPI0035DEA2A0
MIRLRADILRERAVKAGDETAGAIARKTGVRESTVSRLLAGRTTPSLSTLVAMRSVYGISLDDLVHGGEAAPVAQVPSEVAA